MGAKQTKESPPPNPEFQLQQDLYNYFMHIDDGWSYLNDMNSCTTWEQFDAILEAVDMYALNLEEKADCLELIRKLRNQKFPLKE